MSQYSGSFNNNNKEIHYDYTSAAGNNGRTMSQRIAVFAAIIIGVIVLIFVFFTLLSGSGDDGPQQNVGAILQRQNKIVFLIDEYSNNTRSLEAQTKVAQINIIIKSNTASLSKYGVAAVSATAIVDTTAESRLDSAASSTTFDDIFIEVLSDEIAANLLDMQVLSSKTKNADLLEVLNDAYTSQSEIIE